ALGREQFLTAVTGNSTSKRPPTPSRHSGCPPTRQTATMDPLPHDPLRKPASDAPGCGRPPAAGSAAYPLLASCGSWPPLAPPTTRCTASSVRQQQTSWPSVAG